ILNVDISAIDDADGLGSFSYQWLRNGSVISGAILTSYQLGDADVGQRISVQVSYTDGHSTPEQLVSLETAAVANINDDPTGLPLIIGPVEEDQTLNVDTSAIDDADGLGSFNYQWHRNGSAVSGATQSSHQLGDADVGQLISVEVSYTDAQGTAEQLLSAETVAVVNINDLPTGKPMVNGQAVLAQQLSADTSSVQDSDGLGSFNFQWLRNGQVIGGAVNSDYTLQTDDLGKRISVEMSYTDTYGMAESVVSAQTNPVITPPDVVDDSEPEPEPEELPGPVVSEGEDPDSEEQAQSPEDEQEASVLIELADEIQISGGGILPSVSPVQAIDSQQLVELVAVPMEVKDPTEYQARDIQTEAPVLQRIDLAQLEIRRFTEFEPVQSLQVEGLSSEALEVGLAELKLELDDAANQSENSYQLGGETAVAVSMSVSAWFAIWLFRAGSLLACFLSVIPLWKQFDPLPILGSGSKAKVKAHKPDRVDELFQQDK
ncbi:hypothetical protein, partial [Amphritea balenae]